MVDADRQQAAGMVLSRARRLADDLSEVTDVARLKRELRAYSAAARETAGLPDLLVVLVDANTAGRAARLEQVVGSVEFGAFPYAAVGIPDRCIERWFLADPLSFAQRFSSPEQPASPLDCESWKRELEAALLRAEEIVVGGGAEFAMRSSRSWTSSVRGRKAPRSRRLWRMVGARFGSSGAHAYLGGTPHARAAAETAMMSS